MRLKIKIDEINSEHVHVTIFSDSSIHNNGTFVNLGKLVMNISEYQTIGAALFLGAHQMRTHFVLMPEDPKFLEWAEKHENDKRKERK